MLEKNASADQNVLALEYAGRRFSAMLNFAGAIVILLGIVGLFVVLLNGRPSAITVIIGTVMTFFYGVLLISAGV